MQKLLVGLAALAVSVAFVASPALAQDDSETKFQLTLTPGVGIPMGEYADDLEDGGIEAGAGFKIGLTGNYFFSEKISAELNVDWFLINSGIDEVDTGVTEIDVDISGSVIGITGGARYWFTGDRDWTPYVDAAIGIYMQTITVDVEGFGEEDLSDSTFGFNLGAGVDWALGESFAIGPVLRYHYAGAGDEIDLTFGTIEISAALSYKF